MIKFIEIRADQTGVVDLRGLFRVVYGPRRVIVGEMLEKRDADRIAGMCSYCAPNEVVRVIDYAEAFQSASNS